ncbi:MAG: hypothetical protein VR69_13105 [Peptococcaceae bacterium BRH_c4b]|nr:MAG: hypothetical protein VR69_13105 [Peptococcaceae bacterium BRH_c4b]
MSDVMLMVAELMALSARTAPKSMGQDYVNIRVLSGDDIIALADEMVCFGQESKKINFDRDADNVRRSDAVLLLSLKENKPLGLNCGACGYSNCADLREKEGPEFAGPLCAWRLFDVGIALGSAVKTASILNADNRIMYRVGIAARRLGMIEGPVAVGVPISAYSKNIYYDRPEKNK